MPYEEKATWVGAIATTVSAAVYFVVVLGQLGRTPAADIAYQRPMVVAIIASVVLTVVGMIVVSIVAAIAGEITGRGGVDEIDRSDERDSMIHRRGELIGFYAASVGLVGALVLTMTESAYFWIANTIYLSFVVAAVVSAVVKLVAYHRGW